MSRKSRARYRTALELRRLATPWQSFDVRRSARAEQGTALHSSALAKSGSEMQGRMGTQSRAMALHSVEQRRAAKHGQSRAGNAGHGNGIALNCTEKHRQSYEVSRGGNAMHRITTAAHGTEPLWRGVALMATAGRGTAWHGRAMANHSYVPHCKGNPRRREAKERRGIA